MKNALITGANKGLGLASAKYLMQQNIFVIAGCRNEEKCVNTAQELQKYGNQFKCLIIDLQQIESFKNASNYLNINGSKLDILINNAGVFLEENWGGNTVNTVSLEKLKSTFEINFFNTVYLTQLLLPYIEKSEGGRIVNVSSVMASLGIHADRNNELWNVKPFAYDSSKTALNQFTIHLAQYFDGSNHSVVSVHPGWVKTDIGGEMAPLTVDEGIKTIVHAALAEGTSLNGKYLHLNIPLPW
jgi:NAD(P)-dependent dehydrogenase (short-subunit alcohol dehydrogenase family)